MSTLTDRSDLLRYFRDDKCWVEMSKETDGKWLIHTESGYIGSYASRAAALREFTPLYEARRSLENK